MDGDKTSVQVKSSVMADEKAKVDLDSVLINEVGQFGRFQLRIVALAMITSFFGAISKEYLFTTARINTRCLVPECEDASNTVFATPWLSNALPSSGGSFDSCHQFANATDSLSSNHSCPAHLFDASVTLPCKEYVYENQHTVVYDFGLACNEWLRSIIGSLRLLGTFFSIPLYGFVSDRWGRRTAMTLCAINSAWCGLVRYWAKSYAFFITMEFVEGLLRSSVDVTCYVLVMESVGPEYRTISKGLLQSCFALGNIYLGIVAWAIPDWRSFTLVMYAPQLLTISYFWVLPESTRWYLSKGKYEKAEAGLKKTALMNKTQLSDKTLMLLRESVKEDQKRRILKEAEKTHEPWLPVLVFRHKPVLIRCVVLTICWITKTMVTHGLSIMSVNISGNKYINYVAVSAVEIPVVWISVLLMNRIGRKSMMIGSYMLFVVCQAVYIFIPTGNNLLSLAVFLLGKCCSALVSATLTVYSAEVFPTKYRGRLLAFPITIGRTGSMVASLMPAISAATFDKMPFVIFGGFALASGLLLLLMPETLGTKLPDTLHEADKLGTKQQAA